ncbi:MAG: YegP family protein [Flavobacterium sp.]|nr:YegP family protein [Flavobacterium sp.]
MATFVITKRLNGFYKYELLSRKAKPIFTGNDFELRFECEEEIEYLKRHVEDLVFMRFRSGNGKFFFRVILHEKEIAKSRKYTTQLLLQKGINEVQKYVSTAEVLDFSLNNDIFGETA